MRMQQNKLHHIAFNKNFIVVTVNSVFYGFHPDAINSHVNISMFSKSGKMKALILTLKPIKLILKLILTFRYYNFCYEA